MSRGRAKEILLFSAVLPSAAQYDKIEKSRYEPLGVKHMKRVSASAVIVPLLLFFLLFLANSLVKTRLDIPDGIYLSDSAEQVTVTFFRMNNATIYILQRDNGSIRRGVKYGMLGGCNGYNRFIGDLYFTSSSAFSLRRLEGGDRMGDLILCSNHYVGYDFQTGRRFEPPPNILAGRYDLTVLPDGILVDGKRHDIISELPAEYEEYLDVLDSQNMTWVIP